MLFRSQLYGEYPPPNFEAPYTGMDQLLRRWDHQCQICGYAGMPPPDGIGLDVEACVQFTPSDTSLAPQTCQCQENTRPYFTKTKNFTYSSTGGYDAASGMWLDDEYLAKPTESFNTLLVSATGLWYEWGCSEDNCTDAPTIAGTDMGWESGWYHALYDGTATSQAPERNGGNKGPYKMVLNNPEVEKWWQSQDRVDAIVPQLANDNQTEMEAAGTLRDPWDYDVNGTLGPAEFATLTVFKSEPFDFYVSAKDDDDCAQLRVEIGRAHV